MACMLEHILAYVIFDDGNLNVIIKNIKEKHLDMMVEDKRKKELFRKLFVEFKKGLLLKMCSTRELPIKVH